MSRLGASIACELRLQHRNGFYWAVAFVVGFWLLLASRLPALDWALLLPVVVLNNLLVTTFFFVGGLVLLEKAEGSLQARMVTPLRPGEYLGAKVTTLGVLGLVENLVIVAAVAGRVPAPLPFAAGALLAGAMLALFGFVVVSRYDTINEYLLPASGVTALAVAPVVPYLGVAASPLWYLHPLQAPLLLLQAGFAPMTPARTAYAALYAALWTGLLYLAARSSYGRLLRTARTGE